MASSRPVKLSARQSDILPLVAAGMSNEDIGKELGIAATTVGEQCRRMYKKLGARNAAQAVERAWELGLLPPAQGPDDRP